MNEFQRQVRVWRNQIKRWFRDASAPRKGADKGRPNIKMCPVCGRFNEASATECAFCDAVLQPKRTATVNLDGSSREAINPTYVVFLVCIIAYLATAIVSSNMTDSNLLASLWGPSGQALGYLGANNQALVFEYGQWWRVATYSLLHVNAMHIFFNLSALGSLGNLVWEAFGTRRFWEITLVSAITGGIMSAVAPFGFLFPGGGAGFSGALFGYIGALYVFFRQQGHFSHADRFKKYMVWGNLIFIGLTVTRIMPIDNHGHIGGMLGGMLVAWSYRNRHVRKLGDGFELLVIVACLAVYAYGIYGVSQLLETLRQ